jgi:signal peptidase I
LSNGLGSAKPNPFAYNSEIEYNSTNFLAWEAWGELDEQVAGADVQNELADPGPAESSLFSEVVETILLAAIVFFLVNTATGRFRIDGSSMEPNLHDGQYVLINRLVYKLYPPQRGDVIVFRRDGRRDYIKRVMALPGETVEIRDGQVLVDGRALSEPYLREAGLYSMASRTIGPNEYFVLGDNRNNSSDSHNWGSVPLDAIDGKAWLVYWPPEKWGFVPHYSYPDLAGSS